MRTSGGRGAEGWIMAIPVIALIIAASMSAGGPEAMALLLEGTIREVFTTAAALVSGLF